MGRVATGRDIPLIFWFLEPPCPRRAVLLSFLDPFIQKEVAVPNDVTQDLDDDDHAVTERTFTFLARGLRTFFSLIKSEKRRLITASGLVLAHELLDLAFPLIVRELIDYLPVVETRGITFYALALVATIFLARSVVLALERFVQEPLFARAYINLENTLPIIAHEKLLALSVGYHERENTGKKVARVSRGVEKLTEMLSDLFYGLLPNMAYLVASGITGVILDWRLGLIFALPVIPAFYLHVKAFERYRPLWVATTKKHEASTGVFCQSIINIRAVQAFTAEAREVATNRRIREEAAQLSTEAAIGIQKYLFAVEMVIGVSLVATIGAGMFFIYLGWSTLGTVAYFAITGNVTLNCLWRIVHVCNQLTKNLIAAERMHELLREEPSVVNEAPGAPLPPGPGCIAFESVSLCYAGKRAPIFDEFSLAVEPGEMLALVGRSGSGKSSLVSLLLRMYAPTQGAVTLDGANVRSIDRTRYRNRYAYVPQEPEIFDGTILDNVVYAVPDACEGLVRQALEAACLEEVVAYDSAFPKGLMTPVGERGIQLSGGQKQRVAIARAYIALLSGAEVLVLDEATSSLDSE